MLQTPHILKMNKLVFSKYYSFSYSLVSNFPFASKRILVYVFVGAILDNVLY
jgi:hypothetical protein